MATENKLAQAAERARKEKVDAYKKAIDTMEEDQRLFYENSLKREQISQAEFADSLKKRSERYSDYANQVLQVTYMTEQEKSDISREYLIQSEKALTQYYELSKKLRREDAEDALKNSGAYVSDRNYYDNWQDFGDDPTSAFKRVDANLSKEVSEGTLSYDEYYKKLSQFGSQMYQDRIDNSNRWLSHESEMNRLTTEEYIAGLERMKAYTQSYYSSGIISHREYTDSMQSLEERIFEKKKQQHKEILKQAEEEKAAIDSAAQAKIDALEKQYNATIADMDEEDRAEELSNLKAQERIYKNAQTKEGKQTLTSIRERINEINDEERRAELKEDLARSKESILRKAERQKRSVDKTAASKALDFGLYYDEEGNYKMLSDVKTTFNSVLAEQSEFSIKSKNEIALYNTEVNTLMTQATQTLANNILTSFSAFAAGVSAIKKQIFSDVAAVNSLDFSRFGTSKSPIKTSITYNDYGDKNISSINQASDYFSSIGNLIAKGGRV